MRVRPNVNARTAAVVFVAAMVLGIGGAVALLGPTSTGPTAPTATRVPITIPTAATSSPVAEATASGPATPVPAPTAPVEVALATVDRQPSQGGVTISVAVANHQDVPLTLSFDPKYDLDVRDARGTTWQLRWAEY